MTDDHTRPNDESTDAESTLPSDSADTADAEEKLSVEDTADAEEASSAADTAENTPGEDAAVSDVPTLNPSNPDVDDDATDPSSVLASDPIPSADRSLDDLDLADADWSRDRSTASTDLDFDLDPDPDAADDSEGLFDDLLSGEPIFENKEVLRPSYTPREFPTAMTRSTRWQRFLSPRSRR